MAEPGRVPRALRLCRGCEQFVVPGPPTCRFCGGDLAALERAHGEKQAAIRRAAEALRDALATRGISV
ncbi:MAG TPA: hypothetical protein VGB04_07930 [Allosphingosinicella sp.]|jgi:hypothetical protein